MKKGNRFPRFYKRFSVKLCVELVEYVISRNIPYNVRAEKNVLNALQ